MSGPATAGTVTSIWWGRVNGTPIGEVIEMLTSAAESVRSRRTKADVDALVATLDGSTAEAACWWQTICGWPYGFPPDATRTPAHLYPLPSKGAM